MTSQPAILNFEAANLNSEPAVIQLIMTASKIMSIFSNKYSLSKQAQKVKDHLLTNEGEKGFKKRHFE